MSAIRSIHGKQRGGNFGCGPLAMAGIVAITGIGFSWIYERDEPKFMTPLVEKIAPLLPSKTTYKSKQQNALRP